MLGALRHLSSLNPILFFFKGKGFLSPEHEPHLAFLVALWLLSLQQLGRIYIQCPFRDQPKGC